MAGKLNIHQRLNEVRKKVDYLKKDKKVEGYWAVTHDMVTFETRPFLIEFGIMIEVRQQSGEVQDTGKATKKKTPITRYVAFYEIDFVNIDDPKDRFTTSIGSVAEDHGDKAPGKCASYAVKTILLKTLNIPTGESDESRQEQTLVCISEPQLITLTEICDSKGYNATDKLKSLVERVYAPHLGIKKIEDLPATSFDDAVERLNSLPIAEPEPED